MFVVLVGLASAAVRINEASAQPPEFIELYNDNSSNISLVDWIIGDITSNDTFSLNISANGFALIVDTNEECSYYNISNESCVALTTIGSGLNNNDEEIYLYDNNSILMDSFNWSSSTLGESWQYCSGNWTENPPTPGTANDCTIPCIANCTGKVCGDDGCSGSCGSCSSGYTCNSTGQCAADAEDDIYVELDWDEDDIINKGEDDYFKIKVKAYNLENEDYDIKVWIENDDDDVISERYDAEEEEWKSGKYYVEKFIEGVGDESEYIKLRIKDNYDDFEGDATIYARIREYDDSDYIDEVDEDIEVLEPEEDEEEEDEEEDEEDDSSSSSTDSINLGSSSGSSITGATIGTDDSDSSILYKSKSEYIKEYAVYGFGLLCVGLVIMLLVDKK